LTAVNKRFLTRVFSGTAMAIIHCSIVVTLILNDKTSCDLNSLSFIYQHGTLLTSEVGTKRIVFTVGS
jgi:hypothetical protein